MSAATRTDDASANAEALRAVLRLLPTSVAVVAAVYDGQPAGMVVGTFTSVSMDPPLVGFLAMEGSGAWQRIRRSDSFAVSILSSEQQDVCRHFASRISDKFSGARWRPSPSGAPIIGDCVAWFDCALEAIIPAGDHYFVLGAVTSSAVEEEQASPLIFYRREYHRAIPLEVSDWFWDA